jgi:hypothetical protein
MRGSTRDDVLYAAMHELHLLCKNNYVEDSELQIIHRSIHPCNIISDMQPEPPFVCVP